MKSATVTAMGPLTVVGRAKGEPATGVKVGLPLVSTPPRKTEKVLSAKLRTAKSWLVSALLLKLPVTTALGSLPTGMEMAGCLKVPSPLLKRILTVLVVGSVISKS